MSFSLDVLFSRVAWYLYSTADFLVAGRVLGKSPLGAYSMAWTLASVPVEKVTALVMRVTPSFFSAAQQDLQTMRRYLVLLTEGISLIALPAAVGLSIVADDFVRTVLGEKWLPAIMPLRLLAAYAAVRSVSPLFAPVLMALGRTRAVLNNNLLALLLLPSAFFIGSRWGTVGIAAAWMFAHPIVVATIGRVTLREIDLSFARYLRALWPALSCALIMGIAVVLIRVAVPVNMPSALRLALQVGTGAAVYAVLLMTWHRDRVRGFRNVIARLRNSPAAA